ncbi:hypothetical protein KFE94_07235 [bacterium SCSIO 12643]|nr:hypothetical protein KFE94_07235 [bacterium SCSIO 12643]
MIKQLMLIILLASSLSLYACRGTRYANQNQDVTLEDVNVIEVDSLIFQDYLWFKGVLKRTSDTIIILKRKNRTCAENNLTEVSWEGLDDILKIRVYESNFFINSKLVFSKNVPVFLIKCREED